MQRLFSMFPQGGPGIGLLLLRVSVATIVVLQAWGPAGAPANRWLLVAAVLIGALLCVGLFTPYVAGIACVYAVVGIFADPHLSHLASVSFILDAVALALLGPGAHSMDARLFGRRVLVVPPR
jgi:uncharacterized membrane protein YphA (DoxX/SURF4 family)